MRRLIYLVVAALAVAACAMDFKPPTARDIRRAVGGGRGLSALEKRAFFPGDDFDPIPVPGPGDWLAEHEEAGQTFREFTAMGWHRPEGRRTKLYLQPVGSFPEKRSPSLQKLREFASAFFMMEVELLPMITLDKDKITTRVNPFTGNVQVLTTDVLDALRQELPEDAFCILAITMEDLYPDPSWNFVFGQASLRGRVGVYSFARYDPAFYGEEREENHEELILRRSCRVLAHETGHMFGLLHCIYFNCLMNGSNHLEESDSRPLHLCPVCLRKLHTSIGFDMEERYRKLGDFYLDAGMSNETAWIKQRLLHILGPEAGASPQGEQH